ncbi:MAG: hypothetical protein MJY61_06005 [Bacteroidales bacterium]|nr:hypothetical protein [Bacteroidales bacterium]
MAGKNYKGLILPLALMLLTVFVPSFAQKNKDGQDEEKLIRLVKASSIGLEEKDGQPYRKAIDATFLHNGTHLECDTAYWNVDRKYINAWGHVKLTQGSVILTSEKMDYDIDASQAMFRGELVELKDDKHNILRTMTLDYNTKDSLAVFHYGASMKTEDGQVIESDHGYYNTAIKLVNFIGNVNMYTDTVYLRTEALDYSTEEKTAYFIRPIDFWREGDMLSSLSGWYNRDSETFFFRDEVHAMSDNQEAWCDSMFFYRTPKDVLMLGRAQMQDTVKKVVAMSEYMLYESGLSRFTMYDNAAVALRTEHDDKVDTLYGGADTLIYETVKYADIPDSVKTEAENRLQEILVDAVTAYRQKAAQDAQASAKKAAEEKAEKEMGKRKPGARKEPGPVEEKSGLDKKKGGSEPPADTLPRPADTLTTPADTLPRPADTLATPADTLPRPADTLATPADTLPRPADTLAMPADTLTTPADTLPRPADTLTTPAAPEMSSGKDSTDIGFIFGKGNVRIFREDIQMCCDSVLYSDLDSVARFFVDPIIWNEGNRQYSSDSIFVLIRNNTADRASLMSDAMIITQEDSLCYDQIKSTEVMAFFNEKTQLKRFDALGTANAVFYLEENETLATANVVESKMFTGTFTDGELSRVHYFDSPKNDAYPVVQLPEDFKRLKGFNWQPERRPSSKADITPLTVKESQREEYAAHPGTSFRHTDVFFPGCMEEIRQGLERTRQMRDSIDRVRQKEREEKEQAASDTSQLQLQNASDSLEAAPDSLNLTESAAVADSVAVVDSLQPQAPVPSESELRRKAAQERREQRWKALDERDAAKAEAKKQKELARQRRRTLKKLKAYKRQEASDERKLQRYVRMYQKQKEKENRNGKTVE